MVKIKVKHFSIIAGLLCFLGSANAQGPSRMRVSPQTRAAAASTDQCVLNGTYRIDVEESDRLYSVVKNARSSVPFAEQQQFFMDLSTRLTPPDMLAIECNGKHVSVGSSRARKLTFLADGLSREELRPGGKRVDARVTMSPDTLVFTSSGNEEDEIK